VDSTKHMALLAELYDY